MTDFASELRARLLADGPVAALVGTRVYWGVVPQDAARPNVRLQAISDPRPEHLKGYEGMRVTRVQADSFAASYAAARDLSEKLIAALADPAVQGTVKFGRIKAEGPRDLGEDTAKGYVHRSSVDLLVAHRLV